MVVEFGSKINVDSSVKRIGADSAFGNGMTQYLVTGLQQTEQFAILNPLGTKQKLTGQDLTSTGEMKQTALEKISSLEGAEFLIAGELAVYQLSLESLKAGFAADPFFGNAQLNGHRGDAGPRAEAFENLPVRSQDRIAINLRLIDATSGKPISWTIIEGSSAEFGQQRNGLFGEKLMRTSGPLQTPMQKALRVCTIKAVNWIAETGLSYRQGKGELPLSLPVKKVAARQKNSGREKSLSEPTVKKFKPREKKITEKEPVESPIVEKPLTENPIKVERVIGKPTAEKPTPKKEALHREEWGQ